MQIWLLVVAIYAAPANASTGTGHGHAEVAVRCGGAGLIVPDLSVLFLVRGQWEDTIGVASPFEAKETGHD